jgi:GPH family glycoside/pentoside/hexuronide:cation symporter
VHLGLVIFLLLGIPASAFFIIPNTIMGEIIDHDEKLTGRRREAIYFSAQALINKFGLAFSSLFLGFIFQYGYKFEQPLGVRLLGPSAALFVLIGLIIFSFYPLEDAKFLRKRGGNTTT